MGSMVAWDLSLELTTGACMAAVHGDDDAEESSVARHVGES